MDNDNALLINDYEEHNMSKEGWNMCFHRNIVEGVASSMPKEEKVFTKDDKYDLKRMIEKALDKIFSTDINKYDIVFNTMFPTAKLKKELVGYLILEYTTLYSK